MIPLKLLIVVTILIIEGTKSIVIVSINANDNVKTIDSYYNSNDSKYQK